MKFPIENFFSKCNQIRRKLVTFSEDWLHDKALFKKLFIKKTSWLDCVFAQYQNLSKSSVEAYILILFIW